MQTERIKLTTIPAPPETIIISPLENLVAVWEHGPETQPLLRVRDPEAEALGCSIIKKAEAADMEVPEKMPAVRSEKHTAVLPSLTCMAVRVVVPENGWLEAPAVAPSRSRRTETVP